MPIIGSKYLIVGGAGQVGSSLARALADAGEQVIVSDWMDREANTWANLPANLDDLWDSGERQEGLAVLLNKHWREIAAIAVFGGGSDLQSAMVESPRFVWDFACRYQRPFHWASTQEVYGSSTGPNQLTADPVEFVPMTDFGRAARVFEVFMHRRVNKPDAPPITTAMRLDTAWAVPEHWCQSEGFRDPGQSFEAGRMMATIVLEQRQGPFDILTDGKVISLANS